MSDTDRAPRSVKTREAEQRPQPWKPPEQFPMPPHNPGVIYRWIRTSLRGEPDARNVSKRFREGWSPVLASEFPEFQLRSDENSKYKDNIEVGGLMLCSASAEHMRGRTQYYQKLTAAQMESVDNSMFKQMDPRVPMFKQRSTTVIFGRRHKAAEATASED